MWILGLILIMVAMALLIHYFFLQNKIPVIPRMESQKILSLKQPIYDNTQVNNWSVAIRGRILCEEPLFSELSNIPCVYYEMQVERDCEETFYEKDEKGIERRKTRLVTDVLVSKHHSLPFLVQDNTGKIRIDPLGATILAEKIMSRYDSASTHTVKIGTFNLQMSLYDGSKRIIGYRFHEAVLPVGRPVYAIGKPIKQKDELSLVNPPEPEIFLICLQSEEDIIEKQRIDAKNALFSAIMCSLSGIGFIIFNFFV